MAMTKLRNGRLRNSWVFAAALILPAGAMAQRAMAQGMSTYGAPGIVDMPSAFTAPDGTLTFTSSHMQGHTRNTLHFQITPRLSGVFRYAILRDYQTNNANPDRFDRSFDLQYQIRAESSRFPALAIGLQDFGGTGIFGAEYLVASKHLGEKLSVSAGVGWGRFGSFGGHSSPFGQRFQNRPVISSINETGRVSFNRFFRGDAAVFAGLEYQASDRLRIAAEYSSDAYVEEVTRMGFEHKTPINLGVTYQTTDRLALSGFVIGGAQVGIGLSYAIDPRRPAVIGGQERNMPPVAPRRAIAELGWEVEDVDASRARLSQALGQQGLQLVSYRQTGTRAHVALTNTRYAGSAQALGRAARAMTNSLPAAIDTFEITLVAQGMPLSQTTFRRADLEELEHAWDGSWQSFVRARIVDAPAPLTPDAGLYPKLDWSLLPYYNLSLFDPDSPLRADVGLEAAATYHFTPGLSVSGTVRQKLLGTLGDSTRRSNSVLPHVRSDQVLYDQRTGPRVERLTADYMFRPAANLYGRISAGYIEQMYAGLSTEILWSPVESRLALGAEVNYVAQRSPDTLLGLTDYRIATGHASAYYDFGNSYRGQVDVGRYLAGDWGATVSLDRKFDNGVTIGAFFTLTDVPFETFGEGSFDKGFRLTFPIDWLTGQPGRKAFTQTIRPVLRDGGARLSVANRLYQEVNAGNANEMEHNWGKFWR